MRSGNCMHRVFSVHFCMEDPELMAYLMNKSIIFYNDYNTSLYGQLLKFCFVQAISVFLSFMLFCAVFKTLRMT